MANFFARPSSEAVNEMFRKGRTSMRDRLAKIVGDGARVDATPEQIVDTVSGGLLDRFTIHTSRPMSPQSRVVLNALAANVFVGDRHAKVDIAWSRYDTRWFASDWTSQQRTLGAITVIFALLMLGVAAWFEHYRTTQLGGPALLRHNITDLIDIERLWNTSANTLAGVTASLNPVE